MVEADETFVGGKAANRKNHIPPKAIMLALVERDGMVRSFRVANVSAQSLRPVIVANVSRASFLMTDERRSIPGSVASSPVMAPSTIAPRNTSAPRSGIPTRSKITSSIFKRGIIGTYHHVSEAHLHRYGAEFDFRYNHRVGLGFSDMERAEKVAAGMLGKRLTYRRTGEQPNV